MTSIPLDPATMAQLAAVLARNDVSDARLAWLIDNGWMDDVFDPLAKFSDCNVLRKPLQLNNAATIKAWSFTIDYQYSLSGRIGLMTREWAKIRFGLFGGPSLHWYKVDEIMEWFAKFPPQGSHKEALGRGCYTMRFNPKATGIRVLREMEANKVVCADVDYFVAFLTEYIKRLRLRDGGAYGLFITRPEFIELSHCKECLVLDWQPGNESVVVEHRQNVHLSKLLERCDLLAV